MTIRRVTSPDVPEPPPERWSNCLVSDGIAYVAGMTARGRMDALKSEPPRPKVVGTPSTVAAMNPPKTGTSPFESRGPMTACVFSFVRFPQRTRLPMSVIGDDATLRIHVYRIESSLAKRFTHQQAREPLAET